MAGIRGRRRRRRGKLDLLGKPRGRIHPRVQKVGPQHFGIVSVDCAKARSKWMLADFWGNVIVAPTPVEHSRGGFAAAIARLAEAVEAHQIKDLLVAVERTGRYHHPVRRAFAAAGYEVRVVHPLATKHFRVVADPGVKTDDKDLAAIHRAAVNGFALIEPPADAFWAQFQLRTRHRRDLVHKRSVLCCQIKEHLEAAMPGFAACFPTLWDYPGPLQIAWGVGRRDGDGTLAEAIVRAGSDRLAASLRRRRIRCQQRTIERAVAWARGAAVPDVGHRLHQRIAGALDQDRVQKSEQIQALEREIAAHLVATPYVLLLSVPGIHVVSAADYAGEMGPIDRYANARCISGRAGLFPSRYQSDQVDHADGPLVRRANRRLRFALLQIGDNLIRCNRYFGALAAYWKAAGKDPRHNHVRIASRFCRISFHMVAAGQVFRHPAIAGRHWVLQKLINFHREHQTPMDRTLADLKTAIGQLPPREHAAEAAPLQQELAALHRRRRRGVRPLAEVLPLVLAELGVGEVQFAESGAGDPT